MRRLSLLLVVAALSWSACGGGESSDEGSTSPTRASAAGSGATADGTTATSSKATDVPGATTSLTAGSPPATSLTPVTSPSPGSSSGTSPSPVPSPLAPAAPAPSPVPGPLAPAAPAPSPVPGPLAPAGPSAVPGATTGYTPATPVAPAATTTQVPVASTVAAATSSAPVATTAQGAATAPGATTIAMPAEDSVAIDPLDAVFRVVPNGAMQRRPEAGVSDPGPASGFVIDPTGLAVTSSHAVGGASSLRVVLGAPPGREYEAQILNTDECSDLAVIRIAAPPGTRLPYLRWADAPVEPGYTVSALGFQRENGQPVTAKGEIAQTSAPGALENASVAQTVQFAADVPVVGGMEGGPMVLADGSVAGILYPSVVDPSAPPTARPVGTAVATTLAQPLVARMTSAPVLSSIGINGSALSNDEGVAGIWVSGVQPGGPAAEIGLRAGDLITEVGRVAVGGEGTMESFCTALAASDRTRPVELTVLRSNSQLYGALFSGSPLQESVVFARLLALPGALGAVFSPAAAPHTTTESLTDSTSIVATRVPTDWAERSLTPRDDGAGGLVPTIIAATDLDGFEQTATSPGVVVSVRAFQPDFSVSLAALDSSQKCATGPSGTYIDTLFEGRYQVWLDCAGTAADQIVVVLNANSQSRTLWVVARITGTNDAAALDGVLRTLILTG